MIEVISDIIVGLSAIVVAAVAVIGLHTWRRELVGRAKFELAKRLVFLALKLKAGFEWARLPATFSGEYAGRESGKDESPEESRVLDEWYARERRVERLRPDLAELEQAGWEAEILLEKDKAEQVREVVKVFREAWAELGSAVDAYFDSGVRRARGHSGSQDTEKELHRIIYKHGREDEFSKKLDIAVDNLKKILRDYVR